MGPAALGRFHRRVHCCAKINIQEHTEQQSKWHTPVWTVNTEQRVGKERALFTEKWILERKDKELLCRTVQKYVFNLLFLMFIHKFFKGLHVWGGDRLFFRL